MIGKTIGRYRIVAKLGEGGMGTVWKAEDPLLERVIALKFLPESMSGAPEARQRFLREAKAASAKSCERDPPRRLGIDRTNDRTLPDPVEARRGRDGDGVEG